MIITGMHRSGTSLVAGITRDLGISAAQPDDMQASPQNPGGFFESVKVADFNDSLLRSIDASWDSPPRLNPDDLSRHWQSLPVSKVVEWREALALPPEESWAWSVKDPRLSFLLGAWDRLLERSLPVIVCVRNPGEVAHSLHLRDGFSHSLGVALWFSYNRAVFGTLAGRPNLIIDYGRLLNDPEDSVRRIADFITSSTGSSVSADPSDVINRIQPGYRRATDYLENSLVSEAGELWAILERLHGDSYSTSEDLLSIPERALDLLDLAAQKHRVSVQVDDVTKKRSLLNVEYGVLSGQRDGLLAERDGLIAARNELQAGLASTQDYANQLESQIAEIVNSRGWRGLEKFRGMIRRP